MQKNNIINQIDDIKPILKKMGYSLNEKQPNLVGEKLLMEAVTTTSGKKLTLFGKRNKDERKVIIKATKDKSGMEEILHEQKCREALKNIVFSYKQFYSPEEVLLTKKSGFLFSIQDFIEKQKNFIDLPIEKQFELAIEGFKIQEGAHAVTYGHLKSISKTFGRVNSDWYVNSYKNFQKNISGNLPENKELQNFIEKGLNKLQENKKMIEQYSNFLTHTDFVPHNFRVVNGKIYLLDHSAIRFGNKYEGWARFINFMALYNPELERALVFYIKNNRTKEEFASLKLMRIFRLGEIIWYYTKLLPKTTDSLNSLTQTRINFWSSMLEAFLSDKTLPQKEIDNYKTIRDSLRSTEEKERQKDLH